MTLDENVQYWLTSGERDWKTSADLFDLKRYDMSLFFCHLALEKLLKGLVVQETAKSAEYTHDLARLASLAGLPLSDDQREDLRMISAFNIAARYSDERDEFYKKCTPEYTAAERNRCEKLYLWLNAKYRK